MELTVVERLILLNLLPKEGSFFNLKLLRIARENLSFDEKEIKLLKFVQTVDQVTWDMSAKVIKKVEVGEVVTNLIITALKKLDGEGKLKDEHFSLYEKFCV